MTSLETRIIVKCIGSKVSRESLNLVQPVDKVKSQFKLLKTFKVNFRFEKCLFQQRFQSTSCC